MKTKIFAYKGVIGAEKTTHDLEIKTHSLKSYTELIKKGVEKAKPVHYWQMQAGMLFGKFTRALYVALCKNDEAYHIERVREDKAVQDTIKGKIIKLVEARTPPVGLSDTASDQGCMWCDMKEVCTGQKKPIKTCRSCEHVSALGTDGEWWCGLHRSLLTNTKQKCACPDYEVIS